MSASDKNKNYSAGEIRRYLDGELPAAEMHALEAAALEDPFLADALEGMEKDRLLRGSAALPDDVDDLRKRMRARVAKKDSARVLPIYRSWWRIAAAVIVMAGLGMLGSRYLFRSNRTSPVLSKIERPAPSSPISNAPLGNPQAGADSGKIASGSGRAATTNGNADSLALVAIDKKTAPSYEPASKTFAPPKEPAATSDPATSRETARAYDSNTASSGLVNDETRRKKTVEAYYEKLKNDSPHLDLTKSAGYLKHPQYFGDSNLQDSRLFSFKSQKLNKFLFVGKVIDSNDNPIPFATISFSSHHQATRTDNNGLFQFQLLGSKDSLAPVWVTSVGYHPVSLTINALTVANNNALSNVIRLQPETTELNDMVTIGYGTQKKKSARRQETNEDKRDKNSGYTAYKEANLVQHAAPLIGWSAYQNYLMKNRPLKGVDSTLKGTEIIYFEVDRKGRLSSFKVTQSLSPAHDSAIIQLIRQGPPWKPLEGKKASATLTMSF